jgi:hypothetical protein
MSHRAQGAYLRSMTHAVSTRSTDDDVPRQHMEALVTRHLRGLFDRLPMLGGFRLRSDLMVADVSVVGGANRSPIRRLHVRVMQALVELAECDPEAVVLMRGRAFARAHAGSQRHSP